MSNTQMSNPVQSHSLFTDFDIYLFKTGKHFKLYEKLGSRTIELNGVKGVYFAVFAPAAKSVQVIGDFNKWSGQQHELNVRWDESGIWEGFIPEIGQGTVYKYKIHSTNHDQILEKADPFALYSEHPPETASIVWDIDYKWKDSRWMKKRAKHNALDKPYSVYEVHLASWRRNTTEDRFLTYREMAVELVQYVKEMGFTHVELMPVMEHPYDPSWGYQITGFFAPTCRFGTPQDFMHLIEAFHKNDIGVILDWVPSHFPADAHGLGNFDGSHVYEHPDMRRGYHPDWKSLIFNYGRNEIRSFLISTAVFWCDRYHADGLRVDAVASMIHLNYSREEGEWEPNIYGGNENLEAISFLKDFNEAIAKEFPDVQTIAEESTSFPLVSHPVKDGGLGFDMKWMMGWMHDTLNYFKRETIYRKYHQDDITFSIIYAFSEKFMMPLSHDEVVHGKASLINKMSGDEWKRFANLRVMYSYMFTHPGAKLLFMGAEFGQNSEWNFTSQLQWELLKFPSHNGLSSLIKDLNQLYKTEKALHELQFSEAGFEWIDMQDRENSVIVFLRKSEKEQLIIACNFSPNVLTDYRIGVPDSQSWKEIFNSDDKKYWGSGVLNDEIILVENIEKHNRPQSLAFKIPPLGTTVLKMDKKTSPKPKN